MKKILCIVSILFLININACLCNEPLKEEVLDISDLQGFQSSLKNEKEKQHKQEIDENTQQEGMDYMYRMQQQMMRGQNWNQFGGFRY